MKQLLIVHSGTNLNGGAATPQDISSMAYGSVGVYDLTDTTKWLSAKAENNVAIVLGRADRCTPMIIPEVDIQTLSASLSEHQAGKKWSASITIPDAIAKGDFTLVLTKKGVPFNERNNYSSVVPVYAGMTGKDIAAQLRKTFQGMADNGTLDIEVKDEDSATVTISAVFDGPTFVLQGADALTGTEVTVSEEGSPAIGDQKYIQNLASKCAAGKGFNSNYPDGLPINPGYPEPVEDTDYDVINLRFAVGRDYGKQTDERVTQMVHIAVPTSASAVLSALKTIFGIK